MSTNPLGRLQKVSLRDAWTSESGDFTPWLGQPNNLSLLGDAIGMGLEPEAQEKYVGPFRADLLCREVGTGRWVVVENQLERTDHSHLGQLLTYAAGLAAVTIVWIAEKFTEEHRAALDWLNDKTPEEINFFGLEVELWRIGSSPVAPKFNVVCKPNDWVRTVRSSADNSEAKQFCRDYWSGVLKEIEPSGILLPIAKPMGRQDTRFDVGWHTFRLKAYFSRTKKRMGVWVSCRAPLGFENFLSLKGSRREIEDRFGGVLEWNAHEEKQEGTLIHNLDGLDANDTYDWPRQHKMIAEKVVALYRALAPVIQPLDRQEEAPSENEPG